MNFSLFTSLKKRDFVNPCGHGLVKTFRLPPRSAICHLLGRMHFNQEALRVGDNLKGHLIFACYYECFS